MDALTPRQELQALLVRLKVSPHAHTDEVATIIRIFTRWAAMPDAPPGQTPAIDSRGVYTTFAPALLATARAFVRDAERTIQEDFGGAHDT